MGKRLADCCIHHIWVDAGQPDFSCPYCKNESLKATIERVRPYLRHKIDCDNNISGIKGCDCGFKALEQK